MINLTTYKVFAERVKRRLSNGWTDGSFNITNNEIYLSLYEAIALVITAASNQTYAVDGIRETPEAFVTTYKFNLSSIAQDDDTGDYIVNLPTPPLNLPLGYSIISPFITGNGAKSFPLIAINGYQKGYGLKLPTPGYGIFYQVEGSKMMITAPKWDMTNSGLKLHVPMQSPRSATGNEDDVISLSDDAMSLVFDQVIAKFLGRLQIPQDVVNDGVKN